MLTVLSDQFDIAKSVLPAEVFDYYSAGSGDEVTANEAVHAWNEYRLRPHPLRDVGQVTLSSTMLGSTYATPVGVAPTAFHLLAHPEAERASVRGAAAAGALFILSTRSSTRIVDVGAATTDPWWFQVYVMRDRRATARIVEAACEAGAGALVLTGDTPYVGRKRKVGRVRIAIPDDHFLVNIREHLASGVDAQAAASQDPTIGLDTIEWLHRLTGLPVVVKGVLRGDAAIECLDAGAAGVIVSNHGGRQLDRAIPSALALGEVVDAVDGRAPVLVDGGIRSGVDVLIALALGASGVLLGRPILWALAAGGSEGVRDALAEVTSDLGHAMALAGVSNLRSIDRSMVVRTVRS